MKSALTKKRFVIPAVIFAAIASLCIYAVLPVFEPMPDDAPLQEGLSATHKREIATERSREIDFIRVVKAEYAYARLIFKCIKTPSEALNGFEKFYAEIKRAPWKNFIGKNFCACSNSSKPEKRQRN